MYVDLLTRALDQSPSADRANAALLEDVVRLRARLEALAPGAPPTEVLVRQLSYDGALIRLCDTAGVETTVARFSNPSQERARLEGELAARGYALTTG